MNRDAKCDLCHESEYERNLVWTEIGNDSVFICQSCDGQYSEDEIKNKIGGNHEAYIK